MKSVMKFALKMFISVILAAAIASCSSPKIGKPPSDAVCSSIINVKCVKCHYKTRICDALGTKSVGNWERTIKFMVKQGADINQDEQNKVIACLSSLPEGSNVVCD